MDWIPQITQDGSYTFFSTEFGETFHSNQGAKAEAFQKYVETTGLVQKVQRIPDRRIKILDVCYGLGYNTAAALERIWEVSPTCEIKAWGLEIDPTVPAGALTPALLRGWSPPVQAVLQNLGLHHCHRHQRIQAQLLIGDARQTVQTLIQSGFRADAIFFDPFSPQRCPQLWTVEFFEAVAQCLRPDGVLATYSRSAAARKALRLAGLQIGTIPAERILSHQWSQGTVASWCPEFLPMLSPMEQEHLITRASIPYRDPDLTDSREIILARHQAEQNASSLKSTSSWRRRWGIH